VVARRLATRGSRQTAAADNVNAVPAAQRVAVHAVALQALLSEGLGVLFPAERQLLNDWLDRLATARPPMHV
jgi:hypothetical protein